MALASSVNRRGLRRTIFLATAGLVVAGIAAAVIVSTRPVPGPVPIADAAPSAPAAVASPLSVLAAAADALGFRPERLADTGIVENMPPDTQLTAPSATLLAVGAAAPDFALSTPTGEQVRLSDFRGKTVLLEFFATWCSHCQAEVPHLIRLFGALPAQDFAFLSVNADSEDAPSLYAFDRFFHLPWPALLDPGEPAGSYKQAGGAGPVTRAYGIGLYPTFYIIDPNGRVAWRNDREQPDLLLSEKLHDAAGK